jgi:thiamine-phosphate pyrophosphorylase
LSAVSQIWRAARRLSHRRHGLGLPPLLLFTDPWRTPDSEVLAARLPRGAGVVFRGFGLSGAEAQGRRLSRICRRRGLVFLVGADAAQATRLGADGIHLPERLSRRAGTIRSLKARFLVTAAAHTLPAALRAHRAGAQALIVSAVFSSASPSAGPAMGPRRLAILIRQARAPVYALGGVNVRTIQALAHTGATGVAAVEALARDART